MASWNRDGALRALAVSVAATLILSGPTTFTLAAEAERSRVVRAGNAFAMDVYRRNAGESPGNLVICPVGLGRALAMAGAGARGSTQGQMAGVLHLERFDDGVHREFEELRNALDASSGHGVDLRIADRPWLQEGLEVESSFADTLERSYGVRPGSTDFANDRDRARLTINLWAAEKTTGRVRELLAPNDVSPRTRLVLANAAAFDGAWESPFQKGWTRPAPFHPLVGESVLVPLMMRTGRYRHAKSGLAEVLELRYADPRFVMLILLPREGPGGLGELERALDAEMIKRWGEELRPRNVRLWLPRLRAASRRELSRTLEALGMGLAFGGAADFSGITSDEPLSLARIVHEAVVEIDEEGARASAATAAIQEARVSPLAFRVDRPFLFVIMDRSTGAFLFIGRVTDPQRLNR